MTLLRLIDKDTYIESIVMNYTNEWIEEIVQTHNAFKAKDFNSITDYDSEFLSEISNWIRTNETTLLEVVHTI